MADLSRYGENAIAIVGMAGRFPGADDVSALWHMVSEGRSGLRRLTPEELTAAGVPDAVQADPNYVPVCGPISDYDMFDAAFFRMTQAEARGTDPQQRLFLQTAYQALEQAGYAQPRPNMSVAVFGGASLSSYLIENVLDGIDRTASTSIMGAFVGNDKDYLATMAAYRLDLRGPAISVQTACSTGLVAVHLGAQSVLNGESDLALVGSVTVRSPHLVGYKHQPGGVMSADGRCRPFDLSGTGTVFGNGVGVFALRRLEDAVADGDPIRAVICGTAINNDGARKVGFVAPSVEGQVGVIAEAMAVAGCGPDEIDVIEAHGTGTRIGDAIEIRALERIFAGRSGSAPGIHIGSVKGNLGHLETAAGSAALAKTVLALEHGIVPPSVNVDDPIPEMAQALRLSLARAATPWVARDGLRRAGISSFGIGGTNAHIIVAEAPPETAQAPLSDPTACFLQLSAASDASLAAMATQTAAWLKQTPDRPYDRLMSDLGRGRPTLPRRLAIAGGASRAEIADRLAGFAAGERSALASAAQSAEHPVLGHLFAGQGLALAGAAGALYAGEPAFKACLDRVADMLAPHGIPVHETLVDGKCEPTAPRLVQPLSVALQIATAQFWIAQGARPEVVVGHSIGEISAAVAGGLLTAESALDFVARRGAAMERLCPEGAMLAIPHGAGRALALDLGPLDVAARNGPDAVVLAGALRAVQDAAERLDAENIRHVRLPVSRAYHSRDMAPALDAVAAAARDLVAATGDTSLISTVDGALLEPACLTDPAYWRRHAAQPVLLHDALAEAAAFGVTDWLEVGAARQLGPYARAQGDMDIVHAVAEGPDPETAMQAAAVRLQARGFDLHPFAARQSPGRRARPAPGYVFERTRHWIDPVAKPPPAAAAAPDRIALEVGPGHDPYLADHRLLDRVVLPGALWIELATAFAKDTFGPGAQIADFTLQRPVSLGDGQNADVRLSVTTGTHSAGFDVHLETGDAPLPVASCRLLRDGQLPRPAAPAAAPEVNSVDGPTFYSELSGAGLNYGPAFRGVTELRYAGNEAWGTIRVPEALNTDWENYHVHPAVMDAILHVAAGVLIEGGSDQAYLPAGVGALAVFAPIRRDLPLLVHARRTGGNTDETRLYVDLVASQGDEVVLQLRDLTLARWGGSVPVSVQSGAVRWFKTNWYPVNVEDKAFAVPRVVIAARDDPFAQTLAETLACARITYDDGSVPDGRRIALVVADGPTQDASRLAQVAHKVLATLVRLSREHPHTHVDILTRGATEAQADADPIAAGVWSMIGALAAEWAGRLTFTRIDLPRAPSAEDLAALAALLNQGDGPGERFAIRGGACLAAQLAATEPNPSSPTGTALRLESPVPGDLEDLGYRPVPQPVPGPGEVLIKVTRAALNFLDVLAALGQRPDLPEGAIHALGSECAGVIEAVGDGVRHLEPGMTAVAVTSAAMSTHVLADARCVYPLGDMDPAIAASVPVVYGTALQALDRVAHLQKGETVLIHSAAGGVGVAALEIAKSIGAHVIATTSTEAKRAFLRARGVKHIFNSRDDSFVDGVLAATGGKGVDVVVNLLAGDLLAASFKCLGPFGRLVDITKRDIYAGGTLPLEAFKNNLGYSAVDLARMHVTHPDMLGGLMETVFKALEAEQYAPPPVEVLVAADTVQAFRKMARAEQIGKLVLDFDAPPSAKPRRFAGLRPDAAYMITGGLGALGLTCARYIAQLGARHIVLVGRSAPGPDAEAAIRTLRASGIAVETVQADLADLDQLQAAMSPLNSRARVDGVFHLAGVVADRPAAEVGADDIYRAARPKLDGLQNLIRVIDVTRLAHFVVFSSISAHFAPPGQAAYAAANGAMEALARRHGARVLAWGGWAEAGMAARAGTADMGARMGLPAMSDNAALAALGRALVDEAPALILTGLNPVALAEGSRRLGAAHFLEQVVETANADRDTQTALAAALAQMPREERVARLTRIVTEALAEVLSVSADDIDPDRPFLQLGLESLTALEFASRIERHIGLTLNPALVETHDTPTKLANALVDQIGAKV